MIEYIEKVDRKTLGEFISLHYPDYSIRHGDAPMDMDISHGIEVQTYDNSEYGYGVSVNLYPYVKWSDGMYKPCHYWGSEYQIALEKR